MFFKFPDDFKVRKSPAGNQYLAWEKNLMLMYSHRGPYAAAPAHAHPNEQICAVVSGEVTFTLGDETRVLKPNDAVIIPPNVMHSTKAGPDGYVTCEVFYPPREDFIKG